MPAAGCTGTSVMTQIIGAIFRATSPLHDFIVTSSIITGGMLMLGASLYRLFLRPEWTAIEALSELWPFHAVGALTLLVGWLIDRQA
jgi:hypothetical protein